jgi:hypothetical protein
MSTIHVFNHSNARNIKLNTFKRDIVRDKVREMSAHEDLARENRRWYRGIRGITPSKPLVTRTRPDWYPDPRQGYRVLPGSGPGTEYLPRGYPGQSLFARRSLCSIPGVPSSFWVHRKSVVAVRRRRRYAALLNRSAFFIPIQLRSSHVFR